MSEHAKRMKGNRLGAKYTKEETREMITEAVHANHLLNIGTIKELEKENRSLTEDVHALKVMLERALNKKGDD